eukprot:TRINITY_DN1729_c0_g1_i1.p1 TRINITY_DN1729_c0_g1~~TRINITY_DN1729_c0_g1_i1.p1  ORF type:complete len:498 (-),score=107.14 TRINITY_DN1729_c0_g1_i1:44-1537(-)
MSTAKAEEPIKSYWYPDRTADIEEVNLGYKTYSRTYRILYLSLIPLMLCFLHYMVQFEGISTVYETLQEAISREVDRNPTEVYALSFAIVGGCVVLIFLCAVYLLKKGRPVYLMQFTTYQPPDDLKVPYDVFMAKSRNAGFFTPEDLDFQEKLLVRTGLGQETYFPKGILVEPPNLSMEKAREEAEMVLTGCLDQLFKSTHIKPKDIDILIVNCSLFNPTPSIAEMIINKYKLRSDCRTYNISGMGCSAGLVSVDLAKDLLQVHKNSLALVFSTENITQNWYTGHRKAMLISNTLFRMGGAAILLSNKWTDRWNAKYRLNYTVRVHKGANDTSYRSVYQEEDDEGHMGVALSKDLVKVAGDALKSNLTVLGPLVLPWSEQIKFFVNLLERKWEVIAGKEKKSPAYVPDFKKAFTHFCIHAGGRAIIDGIEENLKLEPHHVEPSRATLYRWGNTSSSSIWYELQYIERSGSIKKGETVFQIAFGSGFQCNSAVWKRLK